MTLLRRVTEICRERLPSIRVARITIDSIYDLDKMLQPGIRFGVTVRNTSELVGTPIAYIQNFYFTVDVMDGDERWIIQRMEHWLNGTYKAFYRIFYDEVCQTRLDGVDGEELGWRDAYDVFQLNSLWEKKAGVYNLTVNVPPTDDFYTLSVMSSEAQYAPTHVPVGLRKNGLIITFRSHSEWETWQFVGAMESFLLPGDWKRIDAFIEQGVYDMDQQSPLLSGQYYQCANGDDDYYIPSSIPEELRVAFMKVRYINSYGQRVILRYASSNFAYFHDYDYWDVLKVSDLSSADIEKMLTGLITTHYHDTVQTDRVTPVEAVNAPIARSFSLDPQSGGQGYLIITDAYTFSTTITIELTMSYLIQDSFYRYVLYVDVRHSGPLSLHISKQGDIILKGQDTIDMSLAQGIYKIEFIRQMSSGTDLVLYARHDFIPDDVL